MVTMNLHNTVLTFLTERMEKLGKTEKFGLDTPVFDTGLIDSLALVALIAVVEKAADKECDMLLFDPTVVSTVQDLIEQLDAAISA